MSNRSARKRARLQAELAKLDAAPTQTLAQAGQAVAQTVERETGIATINREIGVDESRQPRFRDNAPSILASVFRWVYLAIDEEPPETAGIARRDLWLRSFVYKEPHLAGVLNSVVDIDKNRGWVIEGGRNQVKKYTQILHDADDNAGWREYISFQAQSYYTTRMGFVTELGRDGEEGPLRALWSVDPARCALTGFRDYPLRYTGSLGGQQDWRREAFFRAASLPSTDELMLGYGFPAGERCLSLAKIMIGVLAHFKQMVLSEVPEGVLTGKNISQQAWDSALEHYGEVLKGYDINQRFSRLMSLMSEGDAAPELAITWFRKLPEGFSLNDWVSILMYGYSLAFGYDPREFYPVSGGQLGTARESDIQHRKSTSKGDLDFSLAYQEKLQGVFPESLSFEFESRDVEGDSAEAAVKQAKASYIQTLAEIQIQGQSVLTRAQILELMAAEQVVPDDFTIFEEPTKETDLGSELKHALADKQLDDKEPPIANDVLQQVADKPQIQEAARRFPDEPIVRFDSRINRMRTLFKPGALARRSFPIAKIERSETERADIAAMSFDEYRNSLKGKTVAHDYYSRDGQIQYDHKNAVEWAMQTGHSVHPDNIMRYPDLTQKYHYESNGKQNGNINERASLDSVSRKFLSDLRGIVTVGFTSDNSILADVRTLVKNTVADSYIVGLAQGGVSANDMDSDDAMNIVELATEQIDHVTDFVRAIREARENKELQRDILENRVKLWQASIEAAGQAGLASAKGNEMVIFRLIPGRNESEESCATCQRLLGQTMRRKTVIRKGLLIKPGNENYECGNWHCPHEWNPANA